MREECPIAEAYETYAPELRRYATTRLRDAAAAEDIVQEAFVRLAVESQACRSPRNHQAWLYRVVLNLIISGARRAAVARRRAAQVACDDMALDSPESLVLASERRHDLGAAVAAAGSDGRRSLILAAQGYSGREIAQILERSEGATRTLMCRARGNVRRDLTSREAAYVAA